MTTIAAALAFVTGIINLAVSLKKAKRLEAQIDDVTAIIKTTDDLRNSVLRPLEGTWTLKGDFDKFCNKEAHYYSKGYLMLQWNVRLEHYDAFYTYSVFEDYDEQPIVTVISKGFSNGEFCPDQNSSFIISFTIDTRTDKIITPIYPSYLTLHLCQNIVRAQVL